MNAQKIAFNIINIEEINSTFRFISDSDLDKDSENKNSKINEINQKNIKKNNHLNNENNIHIHNEINNVFIYNNNNNINYNNNNNNSDNTIDISEYLYIKNEKMNIHKELVQELKKENFIFEKEFPELKVNENNKKYVYWLRNIYLKKNSVYNNNYNKLKINIKYEIPDYPKLLEEIKDNLFFCCNPKCKSIIYLSKKLYNKFKNIPDIYLEEKLIDGVIITGYEKKRCPLCLIYKCKFCKRFSTLKSSLCCPFQAYKACYETNVIKYEAPYIKLSVKTPLLRVWYLGFMTNFPFFRSLTKTHKLIQKKNDILRKIDSGMIAGKACGLYQINLNEDHWFFLNVFHISGSILWVFSYVLFFEEILLIFMAVSFILKGQYYRKFWNCYYLFSMTPGLRDIYGYIIEK